MVSKYETFRKALKILEEENNFYKNKSWQSDNDEISEKLKESLKRSLIQTFETCYDCLWKALSLYLEEELGIPKPPKSPKPLCRKAAENQIFSSPIEQWFKYIDARISTTHDSSEKKAKGAIEIIDSFIDDAIGLYQTMTVQTWE